MRIYMIQTLELIGKTDVNFVNSIVKNSTPVKSENAGMYFIVNDNFKN